jgi:hypothetical protein
MVEPNLPRPVSSILSGGDRRTIGRSKEVVAMVEERPQRFGELLECLWNDDALS